jgi:hypothetical protein
MKPITDRIAKALELIESGKVYKHTDNTFHVLTERFADSYTVTINSCDCAGFESRKATDSTSCKHQWAAIGATAALLIDAIRKAETLAMLPVIRKQYADAMAIMPDAFVRIAGNEYRARHCELNSAKQGGNPAAPVTQKRTIKAPVTLKASHIDESGMMVIKPQSKPSASYNGIELQQMLQSSFPACSVS